jgi:hypothetical protein
MESTRRGKRREEWGGICTVTDGSPRVQRKLKRRDTGEAMRLLQEFAQGARKNPSDFCRLSVPGKTVK